MKIKVGVNFHNRFDIVKNGEWVGYAENIILDQMYGVICNFASDWFYRIYFGKGTGIPTPDRTALFSPLGYKNADTDNIIKAFPTSSFTRKITLLPSEYVGETITEVGIANSAGLLLTHAMLKDSEGNPLSLTKTDLDVVEIYATVFTTLNSGDVAGTYMTQVNNRLFDYFTSNSAMDNPNFVLSSSPFRSDHKGIFPYKSYTTSSNKTIDSLNRKTIFTKRVDITKIPPLIFQFGLDDICVRNVWTLPTWAGQELENVTLGVGDGETVEFPFPQYPLLDASSNVEIKVDDNVVSNYTLKNTQSPFTDHLSLLDLADSTYEHFDSSVIAPINGVSVNVQSVDSNNKITAYFKLLDPTSIVGRTIESYMSSKYSFSEYSVPNMQVSTSDDGENWTVLYTGGVSRGATDYISYTFTEPANYVRLAYWNLGKTSAVATIYWTRMYPLDSEKPTVVFDTPPAEGALVVAKYKISPMYKNENYVLDLTVELQFGEGAMV